MFYLHTKELTNNSTTVKWNSGYPTTQKFHYGLTTESFYTQPREEENNQHVSFHSVQVNIYEKKQIFHVITLVCCFIKDHICRWLQLVFSCSFHYSPLERLIAVTDITLLQEIQLHPSAIIKEIHKRKDI